MKSSQNLPAKLKEYRKKNHYSQEQLAEQMNLSRQAISNWETGKATPDIDNLVMLSELYGTSVDELLGDVDMVKQADDFESKADNSKVLEILCLTVILVLSLNFSFSIIPISLLTITWLIKTKRSYKVIYILCFICIIVGFYEVFAILTHLNIFYGVVRISPI